MYLEDTTEIKGMAKLADGPACDEGVLAEEALLGDMLDLEAAARLAAHPTGIWQAAGYAQVAQAWERLEGRLPHPLAGQIETGMIQLGNASRLADAEGMRRAYEFVAQCLSIYRHLT